MKEYDGAVLYMDILGIGELTSGNSIKITKADFDAIDTSVRSSISNQAFCAALLSVFRRNIASLNLAKINVSQLSDCVFIWSTQPNLILDAARALMWKNLRSGVLCRAGISFGQIVEPDKTNTQIGRFICGDAVTRAALLETSGKGARTFVDTVLPGLTDLEYNPSEFSDFKNASDYKVIDEFRWFTYHTGKFDEPTKSEAVATVNDIIEIIGLLKHSPRYRWNASTNAGRLHIECTIERLSIELKHLDKIFKLRLGEKYYWGNMYYYDIGDYHRSTGAFEGFVRVNSLR